MPVEHQPAQKRRRLPFNPPTRASPSVGPSSKAKPKSKAKQSTAKGLSSSSSASKSTSGKSTSASKRPRAESPPSSASASDAASDSEESRSASSTRSRERSVSQEPDFILAEISTSNPTEHVSSSEPSIPPKLLTRLVHHHFQSGKTKVAKDACAVVAKYVDVFVREAIARAAYERAGTEGDAGRGAVADGFLEVEDLEKMAPQLIMDF